jgi:hypothetical protein
MHSLEFVSVFLSRFFSFPFLFLSLFFLSISLLFVGGFACFVLVVGWIPVGS